MLIENKHILIVEDNVQNRLVYQIALSLQGARLSFDRWGHETLQRTTFRGIDLIVLDLMLHRGISGYNVFTRIRSIPETAHIPIVAVSASEPTVAIPKTQAMGFDGFISKPINDELLPLQLERVLVGEKVWFDGTLNLI